MSAASITSRHRTVAYFGCFGVHQLHSPFNVSCNHAEAAFGRQPAASDVSSPLYAFPFTLSRRHSDSSISSGFAAVTGGATFAAAFGAGIADDSFRRPTGGGGKPDPCCTLKLTPAPPPPATLLDAKSIPEPDCCCCCSCSRSAAAAGAAPEPGSPSGTSSAAIPAAPAAASSPSETTSSMSISSGLAAAFSSSPSSISSGFGVDAAEETKGSQTAILLRVPLRP